MSNTGSARTKLIVLGVAATLGSMACRSQKGPPDEALRHLNVGIGLLEQHRFSQAQKEFQQALDLYPGYVEAHVDLAIAYDSDVKYPEAEAELGKALALDPKSPTAWYMSGLIHKKKGEKDAALAAFEKVAALDPADTDTKYNLATLYKDRGEYPRAVPLLEQIVEAAPHFASAYYALGQIFLRQAQEAKDPALKARGDSYIEKFQKLTGGADAETAGLRYGEQGRYSMALEDSAPRTTQAPLAVRFEEAAERSGIQFQHEAGAGQQQALGSGVVVFDLDGDGRDDVLLLGAAGGLAARYYHNDGQGKFSDQSEASGLAAIAGPATAAAAGDIDNDGHPDLFLAGHLLKGDGKGGFSDVTAASGLPSAEFAEAGSVGFADLDHDGDLDLVASFPGAAVCACSATTARGSSRRSARPAWRAAIAPSRSASPTSTTTATSTCWSASTASVRGSTPTTAASAFATWRKQPVSRGPGRPAACRPPTSTAMATSTC